ncbi:MAG: hypothetical protein B7Y00_01170 [Sphingomonadales bacterium 17-56-6]|nr:MAG: hypothetical protein B7Y00_01170 [Sphingomonadales bacterium 17-56-6]
MSKRDDLIAKYAEDLKNKCKINPDMDLLTKVTIGCGPAIYNADSETVAASDKSELETVKNNFLIKKLGLTDSPALMEAINAHLRPHPIAILACEEVADDWHARYSCIGRAYQYRILNRRASLTLEKGRVWRVGPELDADAMHDAAQLLVGLHDFTTFRSTACQAASPVKTLDRLSVRRAGQHVIIETAALSFLHHQVRSMVGCLVAVGLGRWTAADLKAALDAADRSALAENAPPEGLYFVRATYP